MKITIEFREARRARFYYAVGTLKLGYTKEQGLYAYDGIEFYKIASPYLLMKWHKHRRKITVTVSGSWILFGSWVICFKRDRRIVNHHIPIGETYSREDIKRKG